MDGEVFIGGVVVDCVVFERETNINETETTTLQKHTLISQVVGKIKCMAKATSYRRLNILYKKKSKHSKQKKNRIL